MKKLLNVLLVDDSQASNQYNRALLVEMGFTKTIRECSTAQNALQFLKENINDKLFPDLIFLDLIMPEMNGFGFLEEYSNLELNPSNDSKPVIVILSDHIDIRNYTQSKLFEPFGQFEQMKKPLQLEDVNYVLKKHFKIDAIASI